MEKEPPVCLPDAEIAPSLLLTQRRKRSIINCDRLPKYAASQSPFLVITPPQECPAVHKPHFSISEAESLGSDDSDDSLLNELVDIMTVKRRGSRKGRRVILKAKSAAHSPNSSNLMLRRPSEHLSFSPRDGDKPQLSHETGPALFLCPPKRRIL
jgi:hypothetical protein